MIRSMIRRFVASLLAVAVVRPDHLNDSEIAGFLDRDLSADERSSVESHLESCASCRSAILEVSRMADSYQTASDSSQPFPGSPRRRRGVQLRFVVAAAAGLAIVWLGNVRNNPQTTPTRSVNTIAADSRPVVEIVNPPENAFANRSGLTFVWRSAATSVYRFTLLDETGQTVMDREVSDTVLVLPQDTRLAPGHLYFWRVDAIADGIAASSGARKLRFAR